MGVSKTVIWHKANKFGNRTECGVALGKVMARTRKTWRGVTCKRCLAKKG